MDITKLQLAEILDCSPSFVTHLVDGGRIVPINPEERSSPFTQEEVVRFIESERSKVTKQADDRMRRLSGVIKKNKQKIKKEKQIDREIEKLETRISTLKQDKRVANK